MQNPQVFGSQPLDTGSLEYTVKEFTYDVGLPVRIVNFHSVLANEMLIQGVQKVCVLSVTILLDVTGVTSFHDSASNVNSDTRYDMNFALFFNLYQEI